MSFIKEQGIQPTNNEYIFSEEEIITLIQTYIEQETGLDDVYLCMRADVYCDFEFDGFTVELEQYYEEFSEQGATEEQLDTLFEVWDMELYGSYKVLAEMFGCEEDNMKFKYDSIEDKCIISILTGNNTEIKGKELQLSDGYVKSMRDHAGDYVDDVPQLAEDCLEMKRTIKWIYQHTNDEHILKRIEKLFNE